MLLFNLSLYDDKIESHFKEELKKFNSLYMALLRDLQWVLSESCYPESKDNVKRSIDEHRNKEMLRKCIANSTRIWDIVEQYDYNISQNKDNLILDMINESNIKQKAPDFVKFVTYEKKKIESKYLKSIES